MRAVALTLPTHSLQPGDVVHYHGRRVRIAAEPCVGAAFDPKFPTFRLFSGENIGPAGEPGSDPILRREILIDGDHMTRWRVEHTVEA